MYATIVCYTVCRYVYFVWDGEDKISSLKGVYYMRGNLKLGLLTMHGSLGGENCSN